MPKLGEAYIRVRADLEPFGKDLDRGLKVITDKFATTLNRNLGRNIGKEVGSGTREGLSESAKGIGAELDKALNVPANRQRGRRAGRTLADGIGEGMAEVGPVKRALANFISALEDGFSALPVEIKAVVGGAVAAALIPAAGFLSAGIAAATIAGVATIGVALSSQFQEVEDRFTTFVQDLRLRGVRAAEPFAGEVIDSLDMFDQRLDELDPKIKNLFSNASKYVDPFAKGIAGAVDGLVDGLDRGFAEAEFTQLAEALETGLTDVGVAVGDVFGDILAHPDLDVALRDLLDATESTVIIFGDLATAALDVWNGVHDVGEAVVYTVNNMVDFVDLLDALTSAPGPQYISDLEDAWGQLTGTGDDVIKVGKEIVQVQEVSNASTLRTIKLTEEQEKALEDLNKQLNEELKLTNDVISTNLNYREAIDETIAGFKEYGTSLAFGKEEGRENIENIQAQINKLKEFTDRQIESGQMTEEQARKYYNNEIARLREEFRQRGGNLKQFDDIFAALIKLQGAPVVPEKFGGWGSTLSAIGRAMADILAKHKQISNLPKVSPPYVSGSSGQQKYYAAGGFVNEPTNAILGEGYRDEVVLPLTQPQRSMQLLSQSSLAGMLGGGTNVAVYIGNEQLDAKVYRVASGMSRASARTLAQSPRMV